MRLRVILCLIYLIHGSEAMTQSSKEELYPSRYFSSVCQLDRINIDSLKKLTNSHPDDTLKVKWYIQLSAFYHFCKSDSALLFGERANTLSKQLKYARGVCWSLEYIGNYYGTFGTNELEKSLEYYNKA